MRKGKEGVEDDFGDLHFFGDDEGAAEHGSAQTAVSEREAGQRQRPARQRVELRDEQRSLKQELSDWDDYKD